MTVSPLGDQAILVATADEPAAVRLAAAVRDANPGWLVDVVPAYHRVGVYFDADQICTGDVSDWIRQLPVPDGEVAVGRTHTIPVCYEVPLDLPAVAAATGLSEPAVIAAHLSLEYTVYAVGFVPGFAYLGYLPTELCGVPRLASPRTRVEPGCVGVTGRQTAAYPLPRPGGWHLIGRTPLTLVDVAAGFFPMRVGDQVRFTRIDEADYRRLDGQRLGG